ncbi:bifunctional 4-hydroxy-2-oxoglutarate aldolase/2-dehydro-3-deoxy-phosphogluconate aldolase [Sphingopyxis sp. YF1]|jgi:2-dehydro-3-deoxyphosphogluconate aldolase/(4S)-4-hydroxy-2-oxoglutarate aldolase|uniref:bifunctional 4-hydroxy-2-oxoglutarate aldolase/2-dehydro-3-deoxy-phosphogluconate aldolase n=1 Tax=Sphingopyxis sp. YF1 TaxID=2482763 RepID=UPI001F605D98|nr:bifunctional 4-hydroxy-2-oxoglutarate aldolase/2-dehydro-3-deoxy-phosphogluconate aldolase [Sphingopyxis sp. YF1]UNU41765.1 bifunctional 4-hydroxy-2-oxoglutarate aldolase/2-dehydro-3-deoxy-phosphogluconate aldolase [Sphingopyxis sp. YF1]HZG33481.1 bifunctional 4-hydroxy-2-oxoglutarate aldolase/2-dehydro-3-deoxy-phosphogluconate aldolase [Sphingopyxis sp.]
MSDSGIEQIMRLAPVIPVIVIDRVEDAVPMAEALVAGGLPVLEVTLRTPAALDAMKAMKQVSGAVVGAGTVLNQRLLGDALKAGAEFIVSPGLTDSLGEAAVSAGIPFLPGVANASNIMTGLDIGLDSFKFFPASTSGGVAALKALAGPFGGVNFCPTGGITAATAPEWLALGPVLCVGGSWVVPPGPLDPVKIEALAREAAALKP